MIYLNDIAKRGNAVVKALLGSPAHGLASKGLLVLSYEGRRSGTAYSIPIGFQESDGEYVILLSKPKEKTWWRNFTEPWPAEVLIRRETIAVTGRVVGPDDERFYDDIERTLRRLPWMGSQFGGVKMDKSTGLTDEQRAIVADSVVVVRFTPAA